jgi:hypothetical protein
VLLRHLGECDFSLRFGDWERKARKEIGIAQLLSTHFTIGLINSPLAVLRFMFGMEANRH